MHTSALIAAVIVFALPQENPCEHCATGVLAHFDDMPRPPVEHVEMSGRTGAGAPFRVTMDNLRDSNIVTIRAYVGGHPWGSAQIRRDGFQNLELGSATIGLNAREMEISIRYGRLRTCFSNYDGRDQVQAVFYPNNSPKLFNVSYARCEIVTQQIP